MQKSRIEWTDHSINPVKGLCPVACKDNQGKEYCYARRMYKRFGWNPEIRFEPEVYDNISVSPRGQKIFVGSTIELFGDWLRQEWLNFIIKQCYVHPWHTFIFLTKRPENLIKWSPFPDNCWVGITATSHNELSNKWGLMRRVEASVKFVSLEPLLDWADIPHRPIYREGIINSGIQWVIIGQETPIKKATMPKLEWIQEIVGACDKVGIPVFLKNNLMNMFVYNQQSIILPYWALNKSGESGLRQEFPVTR